MCPAWCRAEVRRGVRSHGGSNEGSCSGTLNGDSRYRRAVQHLRMAQGLLDVDQEARQGTTTVSLARPPIVGNGDDRQVHEDRRTRMDHMQIVSLPLPLSLPLYPSLSLNLSRSFSLTPPPLALYLHRPLSPCLCCLVHVSVTRYGEGRGVLSVARPEIS